MRITKSKIMHMHAVAEFMYKHAKEYGLEHYEESMYVLGLLHDIGYIRKKKNHAKSGEEILKILIGQNNFYVECIADHGLTPKEYALKYNIKTNQIPFVMMLLWAADMSVDREGKEVGFNKRLKDIKDRYGENSKEYKNSQETVQWLESEAKKCCKRNMELKKYDLKH